MNSNIRFLPLAGASMLAAALAACGTTDLYGPNNYPVSQAPVTYPSTPYPAATYGQPVAAVEYGRVLNVSLVSGTPSAAPRGNSAAGAVVGGIVGGLLGHTIGRGSGNTAATVLGAAGGAAVGSNLGERANSGAYATNQPVYRVEVQVDSGQIRTYDVAATGDLRPGDRVRIENGVIYHA